MNSTQKSIAEYLATRSNGVIKLDAKTAQDIINIATGKNIQLQGNAFVKVLQWNQNQHKYEYIRGVNTTDDAVNEAIRKALDKSPIEGFIMYELFNSNGLKAGNIFTVDGSLFD